LVPAERSLIKTVTLQPLGRPGRTHHSAQTSYAPNSALDQLDVQL